MANFYAGMSPEEQNAIIMAGVAPQQTQMYDAQLADASQRMSALGRPRAQGWAGALDALGQGAQYLDGKMTQRRAYQGLQGGIDATAAGGNAYVDAQRRYWQGGRGETGLQQANLPGPAPKFTPAQPMTMNSPSAANLQGQRQSPYTLALEQLRMGGL